MRGRGDSVMHDTPHAQILLPVPGRSSGCGPDTSHAPTTESGFRKTDARIKAAAIRVGARLPAIYRAAVAKPGDSVMHDTPHAQILLPVPGRSRASALLQLRAACGRWMQATKQRRALAPASVAPVRDSPDTTKRDFLIVPTLCVGMPARTLRVHIDAERQSLRYHAERGNDQQELRIQDSGFNRHSPDPPHSQACPTNTNKPNLNTAPR